MHSNSVLAELLLMLTVEGPSDGLRRGLHIPHDMPVVLCIYLHTRAYSVLADRNIFLAGYTWSILRIHDVRLCSFPL